MGSMHQPLIDAGYELKFPAYIDSTMVSNFRACEQQFFLNHVVGIAAQATSPDLHAGGAIAAALEATRRAMWAEGLPFPEAQAIGFVEFCRFWGDYEPPEGHVKSFTRVATAVACYFDHFGVETDPIKPYFLGPKQPGIELRFNVPLPVTHPVSGEPLFYCGRYDMLGLFQDAVYIVDEKSTKSLGPSWAKQWELRNQLIGYVWAAQQHNLPVVGAIIRGIGIKTTDIDFTEVPVTPTADLIERWYNELIRTLERMVRCWHEEYWGYDFAEACNSYGGCAYKPLCVTNSNNLTVWLKDFVPRRWDPLAKDPTHTAEMARLLREAA